MLFVCLHAYWHCEYAIWGCVCLGVCVSLCALFCPSGILSPLLQGTGFGSYPVLSWQWREGCERVRTVKSHHGSLPAVLFHYFNLLTHNLRGVFCFFCFFCFVWFGLWIWGGVSLCTCVTLNVKTDMQDAFLHKNKPSFFSPYTLLGP